MIRDKLLARNKIAIICEEPYVEPYPITQVWKIGNVITSRGAVQDRINIIQIKLYHE